MFHLRRCFGFLFSMLLATLLLSCASTGPEEGHQSSKKGSIIGRLGGPPTSGLSQTLQYALSTMKQGISSVEGVVIKLVDPESGQSQAQATSQADGSFLFENVPVGQYKLAIEQDQFSEVAYAVDTELLQVTANATLSVGLPVVKRVFLPAYPQPTTGSPVALDQSSGRVYMAVDQGLMVLHSKNDTGDLLYTADGFRSDKGPRLLHFVEQQNTLLIITPTHCWIVDEQIFEDDNASEVINYDDPAAREALGSKVSSFELGGVEGFIDTSRGSQHFDPHYYRFDTTSDGSWLYLAAGKQAAVIDWVNQEVKRTFKSSGRLAHYSAVSNRLFFLQEPHTIRLIDAETLLEVATYDLSQANPTALLGVSSRPSNGNGYVAYTRLNINNEHIPFLLIVDPTGNVIANDQASTLLGAGDTPMEPGVPHWQAGGQRFIMGDSLFEFDGTSFQPMATGVVLNSSLAGNGVLSNEFRSADVPNSILISYLGDENAALGFYFLNGSNPNVGIRVVRGRVPTVTLDENHGRGIVFGDGAMSIIYYNAADSSFAQAQVDLSAVGASLLGGASGAACSSGEPCPEEGVCVPVDEFNTDEGTCTSQVYNPHRRFCGGISGVECDPGFECNYDNGTNPQSAGECVAQTCDNETACPEGFYCEWSHCQAEDEPCQKENSQGVCICPDLTQCGPACTTDEECPDGHLCSGTGHCAVDRCLDDSGCPEGKVCGVTEQGRTCVEAGLGQIGDPCISSSECASAYCRAGVCEQSCSKTSDCPAGQECRADDWAGFCAQASCGCGPEEICRDGKCDVGANCVQDADCGPDSLCADGRCRSSCNRTSDCAQDAVCVQGPPHIYGLFCIGQAESWCHQNNPSGCPADAWCSEYGTCQTGQACRDWESDSCPQDQLCIQSACQIPCSANAQCQPEEECTGGMGGWVHTPEGEKIAMTCQPASCHCPNASDLCINHDAGQLGQCWNWSDCTQDGLCPDGYRCEHSLEWEIYRCQCENQNVCGARCVHDDNCQQYHRCEPESGACVMDYCDNDAGCQQGKICGWLEWTGRICIRPGTRTPGAPCDQSEQCTTGACMESHNGRNCVEICSTTGDCQAGQLCGLGDLPPHMADQGGGRICWTPDDGSMCTLDEFEVGADGQHDCSDGTACEQGSCAWPNSCAWIHNGSVCVCSDPVCDLSCADDEDCGQASLGCKDGLCRLKPACSSDDDCFWDKVCGFIDQHEELGPRCVPAGAAEDQAQCGSHADCMSGVCAAGLCARTCARTDDCEAGDECQAAVLSASKVIGICATDGCNCGPGEVCNLEGTCGPGPLCNNDDNCQQGQLCAYHHCHNACQQNSDCGPDEDCTGLGGSRPHVCLSKTCDCTDTQVCEGGHCFESKPCQDDTHCMGGRCVGGQCYDSCLTTSQCDPGLECVAVKTNEWDHQRFRLCVAPVCGCQESTYWCMADSSDGPMGCYHQDECADGCPDNERCQALGGVDQVGSACYAVCSDDHDCPAGAVCGMSWQERGCYPPGLGVTGDSCGYGGDCASGWCTEGWCIEPCQTTSDCGAFQVCGQGFLQEHTLQNNIRTCWSPEDGLRCAGSEFEVQHQCTDGTDCGEGQELVCHWPTSCRHFFPGLELCVCSEPECVTECTDDPDCISDLLTCQEGLCRPRPSCSSDGDCQATQVCGFIDDDEEGGLRCVVPGPNPAGQACEDHSDCASATCAGTCIDRCDMSDDCQAGQECQAVQVGQTDLVLGACQTASCACGNDEVCNLEGSCGPGPLCNSQSDCGEGFACIHHFCRSLCQKTADCQADQDCTGPGAGLPHVCLDASCNCADNQVCEGELCFEASPCDSDQDCQGRCVSGQCYESCSSNGECPAGLECVAISYHPDFPHSKALLCAAPACDCADTDWCLADSVLGSEYPPGCYYNVSMCQCESGDSCRWVPVEGLMDSPCYRACAEDIDCMDTAVCGQSDSGHECVHPGTKSEGESCSHPNECASAACIWGRCINPCDSTWDCESGQVCNYNNQDLPGEVAICVEQAHSHCPDGCADDQWCVYGSCHSGQACWYNDQVCSNGEICDGYACRQECQNSNDCAGQEECIVTQDAFNPLESRKVCTDAACNCPNREDVCIDNHNDRRCVRPISCNFANTCDAQLGAGSGYECSSNLNYTCECTDSSLCGPWCLEQADCVGERVCDSATKSCQAIPCMIDSDCPSGTICPFNNAQRYCAQPGPMETLAVGCDSWQDCQSGMCYQTMCVEPCINNADCAQADESCQMAPAAESWENFPFCFGWGNCGCAEDQFCSDQDSQICQTGPACSGHEDCAPGWCDEGTTRTCQQ